MQKLCSKLSIFIAGLGLLVFLALPARAEAANVLDQACSGNGNAELCTDNNETRGQTRANNRLVGPDGVITRAVTLISVITGVAGVVLIVIGAFKYTASNGDDRKIASARDTILYAIAGMIIAAVSQGIIAFVLNRLTL